MTNDAEIAALAERLPAMGMLIGLALDPASARRVAWYVAALLDAAALLDGFPLADDVEPAPVYRA
jgi:hypothetical protein